MFRPCIDLHGGRVVQIVGSTLDRPDHGPTTNFITERPASWFAARYRDDGLTGGHVVKLGPGNDEAARQALAAWPGGLQLAGGVNQSNAAEWLDAGASHVIVTSWVFHDRAVDWARLRALVAEIGAARLVLDLSCRRVGDDYFVAADRWATLTEVRVDEETCARLAEHCAEFLVHAVDVEGKQEGIDIELVSRLADWATVPCTYAGGARRLSDLETVARVGRGRVGLTIGSALDLFGGSGVAYEDVVRWVQDRRAAT